MTEIAVHPLTGRQLKTFEQTPSHALILAGPTGSGKFTLAVHLVEAVLQLPPDSFSGYSYGKVISSVEGKAIGIEAVRELEHFLSLKVPSNNSYNRAIIIENSHLLTIEAQNALLKTLEEPPDGTLLVLTAACEQQLLPTIRSRAQLISILRPDRTALEKYFAQSHLNDEQLNQTYAISGGRPGLMATLIDESEHPLRLATGKARELLSQTTYERLLSVDALAKQRQLATNTLFILQQMAHLSLSTAQTTATRWQTVLQASYQAAEALENSAQAKLVLTNLMLQL